MSAIHIIEPLPRGWKLTEGNGGRFQIVDERDGLSYIQEPMKDVACKCLALFLFVLPNYMAIYTILHLIRLPVVTYVHQSLSISTKQIITITRIPFYWLALQFSSLYGVFRPLDGRAWFAYFESALHGGKKRSDAVNRTGRFDAIEGCKDLLTLEEPPSVFFAALCFQPLRVPSSRVTSS